MPDACMQVLVTDIFAVPATARRAALEGRGGFTPQALDAASWQGSLKVETIVQVNHRSVANFDLQQVGRTRNRAMQGKQPRAFP